MKTLNIKGKKFGKLTVVKFSHIKDGYSFWECKCDCENKKIIRGKYLSCGDTKSCGCLHDCSWSKIHGLSKTHFHYSWTNIKQRCLNKKNQAYKYYGSRGIKICDNWLKFSNFKNDMYESYLKHIKEFGEKQTTIDRINNDGNYCKENCKWSTRIEQVNNMSRNRIITYNKKTMNLMQWAKELDINYSTLYARIDNGWTIKKAFNK